LCHNFNQLKKEYDFFGGFRHKPGTFIKESYIPGKDYDAVLLLKRKH
jgi:hypothetical protein